MGGSQSYSLTAVTQWYLEGSKLYGKEGFKRASKNFNTSDIGSMKGKVVAITGANKGLGFATAKQLVDLDAEVHLLCRDLAKAEEAKTKLIAKVPSSSSSPSSKVFCHQVDVSSFSNVRSFTQKFMKDYPKLDVLINNAGCMPTSRTLTVDGNESIMATALGGTMLLTSLLLPILKKATNGRVINVSSGGGYSVKAMKDDLNSEKMTKYDGTLIYAFAKRNQIELTQKWASILSKDTSSENIWVGSMHPGWADTEGLQEAMTDFHEKNKDSLRSAAEGADTITFLASTPSTLETGKFWFEREKVREHMPFGFTSISEDEQTELWDRCKDYVGGIDM